jgi:hypothetical protein
MMKTLLKTIFLLLTAFSGYAQLPATRQNAALMREERYVTNSPSNGIGTSRRIEYTKDSTTFMNESINVGFSFFGGSRNDANPLNFLWTDVNGFLQRSTLPAWLTQASADALYYPLSSNPSGFLTSVPAQSFASLTGKPTTLSGYGITDAYPLTGNPSGFLTSTPVSSVFGRTGAIVATSGDYNTSQVTENTNLYYTDARFNTTFSGKSTTDLAEGTNQYFTNARTRSAISLGTIGSNGVSTYNSSTGAFNIPNYTVTAGTGISVSGSNVIANTAPDQTVSITGANNLSVTGTYPNFTVTQYIPTITSAVTRPINGTTFTVSSTKQAFVNYNVTISCTATIGSASTGSVALQYSVDAGSNWITVGTVSNSNTVTLAIVLNSVQVSGYQLSGYIPTNALVRMNSSSSGTTVISYVTGQETY